jgi:hypothetical protein
MSRVIRIRLITYIVQNHEVDNRRWEKVLELTRDDNWDLKRIQFEKDKGNISREQDYVNKQTKQRDIHAAIGKEKISSKGDETKLRTTSDKEC